MVDARQETDCPLYWESLEKGEVRLGKEEEKDKKKQKQKKKGPSCGVVVVGVDKEERCERRETRTAERKVTRVEMG